MIIHLYAQCWNDEWMLPFFFRHYDGIVDRYFIHDDSSTDASAYLLKSHPKVQYAQFERTVPGSFVLSEQAFSNHCWKQSRGKADWVIVTDVDEHLFHQSLAKYLEDCSRKGISLIPALGFQMISDRTPLPNQTLSRDYVFGAPWVQMMKPSIFNPNLIDEIDFAPGRHTACPTGTLKVPDNDELLLFHYKYMGLERTHQLHEQRRTGLGPVDLEHGWGHKYSWSKDALAKDWQVFAENAIDTTAFRRPGLAHYPIEPWWDKYRATGPEA